MKTTGSTKDQTKYKAEHNAKHNAMYYRGDGRYEAGQNETRAPKADEVRVKIAYCGICGTDLHIYRGHMDARTGKQQVTGHECAGEIVELGSAVQEGFGFALGDKVAVRPLGSCGNCPACEAGHSHICHNLQFMGVDSEGAFQQYWVVPAKLLHKVPEHISLQQAALIEPLSVACHDVRLGQVQAGEYVVVLGGGPIGMLVAMVAKQRGARVLVSEINNYRLGLARELGLDVINPKEQDLLELVNKETAGTGADVVFEVTGTEIGAELMAQLPRTRGRIVVVAIYACAPKVELFRFFWRELQLCGARVYEAEDFEEAIHLVADGLPVERLISKIAPLAELPQTFETFDNDPKAMKVLFDCQAN